MDPVTQGIFNSPYLDTIISLVLVFALLSILVSILLESWNKRTKERGVPEVHHGMPGTGPIRVCGDARVLGHRVLNQALHGTPRKEDAYRTCPGFTGFKKTNNH